MPYPGLIGGGGGGFTLGPAQNRFEGADRAAAESARDTYFSANPSNLATYNSDQNLNIILQFTDNGNGIAVYQVRNSAGTAWLDNSSALGVAGRDGTATIPGVPDGTIPMVQGGALVASSLSEAADRMATTKQFEVPGGGGVVISNWDISAQGNQVGLENLATSQMFIPVASELTVDGAQRPSYAGLGPVSDAFVQPLQDATIAASADTYQFSFANQVEGTATTYRLTRPGNAAVASNCNLIIRLNSHADPIPLVDYKRDHPQGSGFDLQPGQTDINLPVPAFFPQGILVYITLVSDDGDNLNFLGSSLDLGDGAQLIPSGTIRGRTSSQVEVARLDDIPTDEATQDLVAAMFTGGTHNGLTVQYDDTNGVINLNVTGVTPPIAPDPGVSGLSSTVPSRVETGTNLNENAQFTFTTQATDQITALNLVVTGGDDKTITVPSSDGTHTVQIALTGIDTSSDGQVTFQIRGTTSGGQTIMSNTLTTQIRTTQPDELAYFAVRPTNDFATVDLASLTSADVQQPGSSYEISVNFPATEILGILEPADRPITRITEKTLGIPILDTFQRTNSARTINGQLYNLLMQTNNGRTAPIDYEVFHG